MPVSTRRRSGLEPRIDSAHGFQIGCHCGVDEDALEGVIEVPMVVQVLIAASGL